MVNPTATQGKAMLRLILAAAILTGTAAVVSASPFTNATCSSPAFKSYMLSRLGHGQSMTTGRQMTDRFDFGPILQSQTVSDTGDEISCEISVRFASAGASRTIRGRFTATQASNGRGSWRWQPGS